MATVPFNLPQDRNGNTIFRFMDLFEYVGGDAITDANNYYYRYLHTDGPFIITKLINPGQATEHMMYYLGSGGHTALATAFSNRAGLTFVEYDDVY